MNITTLLDAPIKISNQKENQVSEDKNPNLKMDKGKNEFSTILEKNELKSNITRKMEGENSTDENINEDIDKQTDVKEEVVDNKEIGTIKIIKGINELTGLKEIHPIDEAKAFKEVQSVKGTEEHNNVLISNILNDSELVTKASPQLKGIFSKNIIEQVKEIDTMLDENYKEIGVNAKELVELLQDIAGTYLNQQNTEKVSEEEVGNLVSKADDLLSLLSEMQNLLNLKEPLSQILTKVNGLNENTIELKNSIVDVTNIKDLKEISNLLNNIKNSSWAISNEISGSEELKVKFTKFISKLNEIDDAIVEIKEDKTFKAEVEIIQLIKNESVSTNDSLENRESEISENNIAESNLTISKADSNLTDKTIKDEKPLVLNMEQLKQKVNDKINLIEKMSVSKDKMLIQLNPKNMGNVDLFFKKTADGIELTVELDEKNTKHKIEMIFDDMKRDFKERSIELNFVFKEKQKNEEENSERKNEYKQEERSLENEKEPEKEFQDIMERVLRGE